MGDFTQIGKEVSVGTIDLVIGGTPCQSFSVAGRRGGLADPRGNLTLEYFAFLDRLRPRWMVWENVPGLLSDDGGRTFGTCLGLLAELGYGFAYRILDAEYFGVPQRRHRVFLVGYRGDWRPPAAVLFERYSLSGHPAPGGEAREDLAACLTQGVDSQGKGGYAGRRREDDVNLVSYALGSHASAADAVVSNQSHKTGGPTGLHISEETAYALRSARSQHGAYGGNNTSGPIDVATACNAHGGTGRCDFESETFIVSASESGQGFWQEDIRALRSHNIQKPEAGVVMASTERTRKDGRNLEAFEDVAYALTNPGQGGRTQSRQILAPCLTQNYDKQPDNSGTGEGPMLIQEGMMVRRLTPRECERLQGLEDDYTLIPYRGKPAKDAPRYRAIGNSFAVPVVRWIAQRIQQVEGLL